MKRAAIVASVLAFAMLGTVEAGATDKPLPGHILKLTAACQTHDKRPATEFRQALVAARTSHPGWRIFLDRGTPAQNTAAASWLATHLGVSLYRVELGSIVSKYIGETEKNLASLLARAEKQDFILFFDEADALFGRRTDVQDANDRYADASTSYVLQRLQSYAGIVVFASNQPMPPPLRARVAKNAHAVVPLGADRSITWKAVCRPVKK
ncbi:MAG: AAA family ATPase [Myxococcota bacterium]